MTQLFPTQFLIFLSPIGAIIIYDYWDFYKPKETLFIVCLKEIFVWFIKIIRVAKSCSVMFNQHFQRMLLHNNEFLFLFEQLANTSLWWLFWNILIWGKNTKKGSQEMPHSLVLTAVKEDVGKSKSL